MRRDMMLYLDLLRSMVELLDIRQTWGQGILLRYSKSLPLWMLVGKALQATEVRFTLC